MTGTDYEFPPGALFSTIAICPWRERSPGVDGSLGDWTGDEAMPPLGELAGKEQFAAISMAWNDHGLYLAVEVPKEQQVVTNRQSPSSGDAMEIFIDTRASRESHRASQFCYHLTALPLPPGEKRGEPVIWQSPIRRARQRAPEADFDAVRIASGMYDESYCMEIAFEPEALHGYEPAAGARIGMALVIYDIHRGRQLWGTASDFPYERDPSTWGIVEHEAQPDEGNP